VLAVVVAVVANVDAPAVAEVATDERGITNFGAACIGLCNGAARACPANFAAGLAPAEEGVVDFEPAAAAVNRPAPTDALLAPPESVALWGTVALETGFFDVAPLALPDSYRENGRIVCKRVQRTRTRDQRHVIDRMKKNARTS